MLRIWDDYIISDYRCEASGTAPSLSEYAPVGWFDIDYTYGCLIFVELLFGPEIDHDVKSSAGRRQKWHHLKSELFE